MVTAKFMLPDLELELFLKIWFPSLICVDFHNEVYSRNYSNKNLYCLIVIFSVKADFSN